MNIVLLKKKKAVIKKQPKKKKQKQLFWPQDFVGKSHSLADIIDVKLAQECQSWSEVSEFHQGKDW
jgi:hypothetical protein